MNDENKQSELIEHIVPELSSPLRLDRYLAQVDELKLTRSKIQKMLLSGDIRIDGNPATKKIKVKGDEKIVLTISPAEPISVGAENIDLEVVYQDKYLAVVNKPAGMVTHPATGNLSGTLVNALVYRFGTLASTGAAERPGIVHRLDKDTSGLILVALADEVLVEMQRMIQEREVARTYHALVCGHLKEESGTIDLPVGRSLKDRRKMAVTNVKGRSAQTSYKLLERYRAYDFLELKLHTGRTHQIRVHLTHIGHPVFGDPDYGGREKWHKGIFAPERPLAARMLQVMPR